jgi:hypothetical protein
MHMAHLFSPIYVCKLHKHINPPFLIFFLFCLGI